MGGAETHPAHLAGILESVTEDAELPTAASTATSGEPLWSLQKDGRTWSAELRNRGTSVGIEAQILRDGELVSGRRFDLRELATRWAEQERQAIERGLFD